MVCLHGNEQQLAGTGTGVVVPMTASRTADKPLMVTRGKGCGTCNKTGYRGRIAVHELLVVDEPLRSLIVQNRPVSELEQHLVKNGFKNMLYDGLLKIRQGHTTIEEVLKAVADE